MILLVLVHAWMDWIHTAADTPPCTVLCSRRIRSAGRKQCSSGNQTVHGHSTYIWKSLQETMYEIGYLCQSVFILLGRLHKFLFLVVTRHFPQGFRDKMILDYRLENIAWSKAFSRADIRSRLVEAQKRRGREKKRSLLLGHRQHPNLVSSASNFCGRISIHKLPDFENNFEKIWKGSRNWGSFNVKLALVILLKLPNFEVFFA